MGFVAHWDEIAPERSDDIAHLRSTYQDLGRAAGALAGSVLRAQVDPGCRPTPVHQHFDEEEFVFVLGGDGWSWQDGRLFALAAGDVVLHRAGEEAHTLLAGDDGLDFLVFGAEPPSPVTYLPRARVMRTGGWWVDFEPDSPHPFEREPAELPGEVVAERPPTMCALTDVAAERKAEGATDFTRRAIGRHLGARRTGLQHVTVAPGAESWPPHCHSAEHELFVVLEGSGVLVLGEEEIGVRAGCTVARPAGTGVAHQFRAAASEPLTYLAWGDHDPNDMTYYPRSHKVALRGLGVRFFVEPVGFWDGEA